MANARYDAAFKLFDADNDGKVTKSELGAAMKKIGRDMNDGELTALMKEVDLDANGHIDKAEFYKMMEAQKAKEVKLLQEAFNKFDKDGNGFISKSELKLAMKGMGVTVSDQDVDAILKDVDTNQDGKLSFDEFKTMMTTV